jgi:hypothetical protein
MFSLFVFFVAGERQKAQLTLRCEIGSQTEAACQEQPAFACHLDFGGVVREIH